jgi:hypothetical protein
MKPDCRLLYNWLNPALMMVANIPEPVTEFNRPSSPSPSSFSIVGHLSPGAMPRRGGVGGGRTRSQSEDSSDLGSFFKDVVACHQHRQIIAFETPDQDQAGPADIHLGPDELDDPEKDSSEGVVFPLKYKPGWTYFAENRPSSVNMRSHIFVEEGRQENDDIFSNMKRNRVVRNGRCKSERLDSMRTHFDTPAESRALRDSCRTQSFDGTELDRLFTHGKPSPQSRPGVDGRSEKCQCRSKSQCSCATSRKKGRGKDTESRASVNPIENEVELEKEICTRIIQTMSECRGDVPEPLEMLFSSIRDICMARNLSGVDSRATGCNVYYSCCSTLLINQLLAPALVAPVKWNIAVPAFLNRRGHNHSDRGSIDLDSAYFTQKKTVVESSIKVTFDEISPLRVARRTASDCHKMGADKRGYSQDDSKTFKHIEGHLTPTSMANRISKMLSNNSGFDSLNSSHKTRSTCTASSTPSQSTDQLATPTRNRAVSLNLSPERLSRSGSAPHMETEQDASSSWRSNKVPTDGAPKKLMLSDNLMHAAISLLSIAHILAGEGEGKSEDALLFVWGGTKDQGREVFQAARALIANVPMRKVTNSFLCNAILSIMLPFTS